MKPRSHREGGAAGLVRFRRLDRRGRNGRYRRTQRKLGLAPPGFLFCPIPIVAQRSPHVSGGWKADICSAANTILYSITSSARSSSVGGTVSPSALAVLRLISSSNFVGCSTGRSAGFAPLRILSINAPARRYKVGTFGS